MKRIILFCCILLCQLAVISLDAASYYDRNNTEQNDEQEKSKTALLKMCFQMERLRKDGHWLEAMDTATLVLTYDNTYRTAVDFVYRYWDKTMRITNERLQLLNDDEDLAQAQQRCEIYRVLDEVHYNLRQVKMPLYGPNERWVWQPEIGYYTGHYDAERIKTYRLLVQRAEQSLKDYDVAEATLYYQKALDEYLITDRERDGNKKDIIGQCNRMIEQHSNSSKIYNSIFAYDLCTLSLQINPEQPLIAEQQRQIQKHIAELYLQEAEAAILIGDSIQAQEMRLSYEEWNPLNTYEKTDNK